MRKNKLLEHGIFCSIMRYSFDTCLYLIIFRIDQIFRQIIGMRGTFLSNSIRFLVELALYVSGSIFITKFPVDQAALAKTEVEGKEVVADRFELVIHGIEVANGYHELTDADELQRRMDADNREREDSGLPILGRDPFLLASMREGLPACAGVAVGLDRLLALAGDHDALSEVMAFPFDRV